MKKYQIIQKGNGKFFVRYVGDRASCMLGSVYYNTKPEALSALKQFKREAIESERLNAETVVYEEEL